jgi:hypothetical protein
VPIRIFLSTSQSISPLQIVSMVLSRFGDTPVSKRIILFGNQLNLFPILLKIVQILIAVQSQERGQTKSTAIKQ